MTAPDLPPLPPVPPGGPIPGTTTTGGPSAAPVFPASAQLIPLSIDHPHPALDAFPVAADPALAGHDPLADPDYSLTALGLDGDPVARVLWLRAELERAVEELGEQERAELVQYGWPPVGGHLRAVA
ncbi:hypothetical protein [Micromonospora carbonacea]|uniref:Uncharacterized protein n=1 Tax=Micromonospora carbonacea TaxID=47853 RepID=A0A1C5AZ93_9ACTN|nr:hypothetical protein [Micromonospora carbonacea]SCF50384.1 hypothetical protein GA0070563_1319 [Micromonospora carbonacea]